MNFLRTWMYSVGALYMLMAFFFSPPLTSSMLPMLSLDLEPGAREVVIDGIFFISAIVAVLGVFLLKGADQPHNNRELVKLTIWVELIAGAVLNVYLAVRGYGNPAVLVAIGAAHGAIALAGREGLKRARRHLSAVVRPMRRAV